MPDREKVIEGLEDSLTNQCCGFMDGVGELYAVSGEDLQNAIALLKEREAVTPILMREGRNKYYNDYVCPCCDNELGYGQNFCSECGRAVKWE